MITDEEKLKSLGNTEDEIRASFVKLGIKGSPTIPNSCLVAKFLGKELGYNAENVLIYSWDSSEVIHIPNRAVSNFMNKFDAGEFPELVEPKAP